MFGGRCQSVLRSVDTHLEMQCVGQALANGCPLPPARSLPHEATVYGRQAGGSPLLFGALGLSGGAGLNLSAWWLVGGMMDGWLQERQMLHAAGEA